MLCRPVRPEPPINPKTGRETAMSKSVTSSGPRVGAEAQAQPVSETGSAALGSLGLDVGQCEVTACLLLADGQEANPAQPSCDTSRNAALPRVVREPVRYVRALWRARVLAIARQPTANTRSDSAAFSSRPSMSVSCALSFGGAARWWPTPCMSAARAANVRSAKDDAKSATYLAVLWG
jgi:hypothetical protein